MEGPLLMIKAWAFVLAVTFVYRRWFERVAPRCPDFEAACSARPPLVAIAALDERTASELVAALGARLGKRQTAIATLGGWPWPNYALELELEARDRAVILRTRGAKLLKTHGLRPPALTTLLRDVGREHARQIEEIWLRSDLSWAESPPDGGWRLVLDQPRLVACSMPPHWLAPIGISPARREIAPAGSGSLETARRCA